MYAFIAQYCANTILSGGLGAALALGDSLVLAEADRAGRPGNDLGTALLAAGCLGAVALCHVVLLPMRFGRLSNPAGFGLRHLLMIGLLPAVQSGGAQVSVVLPLNPTKLPGS